MELTEVYTVSNGILPKINVIEWLEFGLSMMSKSGMLAKTLLSSTAQYNAKIIMGKLKLMIRRGISTIGYVHIEREMEQFIML